MNRDMSRGRVVFACLAATVSLLAACGGGSGTDADAGPTPQQIEDRAASASVAGLLDFALKQIAQSTSETSEPRAIEGITPPVSDTTEGSTIF